MSILGPKIDLEPLLNRLSELEAKQQTFGSAIRSLELEWIETYDKVSRQMSRMAKRYAVDVRENDPPQDLDTPTDPGNRVDTISAGILRRRAGNGAQQ